MKTPRALLVALVALATIALNACTDGKDTASSPSVQVVASSLGSNKLGVSASDLREKPNPKGDGVFVYVPKTRFSGVERFVIWMVIDGQAYPLNGATKDVTPNLKWPREAPDSVWRRTNIDRFMASEAIEIVFGKE